MVVCGFGVCLAAVPAGDVVVKVVADCVPSEETVAGALLDSAESNLHQQHRENYVKP